MASIGSLTASLTLQTAAFTKGFRDSTRTIRQFERSSAQHMRGVTRAVGGVQQSVQGLTRGLGALGAVLSVRAFTGFTRQALDSASAIKDAADTMGLATDRLQTLRFAASQTGAGMAELDRGMVFLNRNLGQFVESGTGPAAAGLKQLGLDARIMSGELRTTEEVLDAALRGMAGVENASKRAAIAASLFGREAGPRLALLVRDGVDGLKALEDQAVSVGAVLSSDVLAAAKVASDNLAALQSVFSATFSTAIIESFAGSLTDVSSAMQAASQLGRQLGTAVGTAMRGLAAAAKFAADNFRLLATAAAAFVALKLATVVIQVGSAMVTFAQAIRQAAAAQQLLNVVVARGRMFAALLVAVVAAAVAFEALGGSVDTITEKVEDFVGRMTGAALPIGKFADATDDAARKVAEFKENLKLEVAALANLSAAYLTGEKAVRDSEDAARRLNIARQLGIDLIAMESSGLQQLLDDHRRWTESVAREKVIFDTTRDLRQRLEDQRLLLRHLGRETEEYRVQAKLIELKRTFARELTEEEKQLVVELERGTSRLETMKETFETTADLMGETLKTSADGISNPDSGAEFDRIFG